MEKKTAGLILLIIGAIVIMLNTPSANAVELTPSIKDRIKRSPQFNNGKFKGNTKAFSMPARDWLTMTCRFLFEKNDQMPTVVLPTQQVDFSYFSTQQKDQLNSTWLGHSSIMLNINGYKILFDPVFEKKVSIVGPTRFNGDVPFNPEMLSNIDVVIISHNHYDHLNKYSIQLLTPKTKKFIVPLLVGEQLVSWGVPHNKIVELDWWEGTAFDNNLKITATPAQHFSGRGVRDRNKTLWASWVITTPEYKVFFSGDSGYFNGFKDIGNRFGPFDITFIECGAYDELWRPVHMFPEETVQAHLDLKGKVLHPIHWGTFNLALHSWYDPMQRLAKAATAKHIVITTPMAGQSIQYGSGDLGSYWWELILNHQTITVKNRRATHGATHME